MDVMQGQGHASTRERDRDAMQGQGFVKLGGMDKLIRIRMIFKNCLDRNWGMQITTLQ